MVRGLYTAAAGMLTIEERTAVTANNLANVDTAGFKNDLLTYTSAPGIHTWRTGDPSTRDSRGYSVPQYIGVTNAGVLDTSIWRDFSPGALRHTGNPLDIAINDEPGSGLVSMLRVVPQSGPGAGEVFYTRAGQLKISGDGFLVDNQGRRVQGDGGDVVISEPAQVEIDSSGNVRAGTQQIGRLSLAAFDDPQQQLEKAGDNLWRIKTESGASAPAGNSLDDNCSLEAGSVEGSNASTVTSLVELISQMRHFEASQKLIQTQDSLLNLAANQIGRQANQ